MHAVALDNRNFGQHLNLLTEMYRLRRRVFKDRLDWAVSVSGDLELDVYDALNPIYLLVMSDEGNLVASVRLLPTMGPTMLADTFPALLGGQAAPHSEKVLESSRFCVDTKLASELAENGLNRATFILFAAMIEGARAVEAESIVTVTDTRMERILRRAGWPLERIAPPQRLGQTMALAGYLQVSDQALAAMHHNAGVEGPVLLAPNSLRRLRSDNDALSVSVATDMSYQGSKCWRTRGAAELF
jgi:acyl homoserine lactone synthase